MSFLESLQSYTTGKSGLMFGLVTAIVTNIGSKKEDLGKVKVKFEISDGGVNQTDFIPVMTPYASSSNKEDCGFYTIPEVGSRVVIAFLNGDRNSPIVIGTLYSNNMRKVPDKAAFKDNHIKKFKTKGGNEIIFDDTQQKQNINILTPKGNNILITDKDQKTGKECVKISDKESKNVIEVDMNAGQISLDANKVIELKVGKSSITIDATSITMESSNITMKAKQNVSIQSTGTMTLGSKALNKIEGKAVTVKADAALALQGKLIALS